MKIAALRRYPVKSVLGEDLRSAELGERGVPGDRRFALVDAESGLIASAKQPRLWRALLSARAEVTDGGVRVAFPDGSTVDGPSAGLDRALSKLSGREVRLTDVVPEGAALHRSIPEEVLESGVEAEVGATVTTLGAILPGTFFDFAPVHIVTTATLTAISARSPRGTVEVERYRPNLVVDTGEAEGFVEDEWPGRVLVVGGARLRVLLPSPRCAIPTLAHGSLPADRDALRVLASHHRVTIPDFGTFPTAGVYAVVEQGGAVAVGDGVELS
ncbi:MOSC N-terminal beta barrel domain-containing protein [Phytomonospora sp. NPDC050363]|uniref:MOSC domain-containing protein n=1 Tax=Phytomonospora sp. NPDC050363 TaxID=3155642 RepID=UPI0033C2ED41